MFFLEKRTLNFVNQQRERRGLQPLAELPSGGLGDPHGCVIQRALSLDSGKFVRTGTEATHMDGEKIKHPWYVRRFIFSFDNGFKRHLNAARVGQTPLVYAEKVMSRKEKRQMKQEMAEMERTMRLDSLEKQLEGLLTRHEALESSFVATSQNLRKQIRALREEQVEQKSTLREMLRV